MPQVLYVYAIGRRDALAAPSVRGVDGSSEFVVVADDELAALCSRVGSQEFSQETIDSHASDLDWLGEIGYRHQDVVGAAFEAGDIVPLRAFTLFSGEETLREHLRDERAGILNVLERVRGREEWTVRISFEHEAWRKAVESRSPRLAELASEAGSAPAGRAYLLRKKMDEERKNATKECEGEILAAVEAALRSGLGPDADVRSRPVDPGVAPQIDVLVARSGNAIERIHRELATRFEAEGVELTLSGPWPPYTFVAGAAA